MSDDTNGAHTGSERDVETGAPVTVLAGLEWDTSPKFLTVLRRKIHRRSTVSQVASFSWNFPKMIFVEFWSILAQFLIPRSTRKGGKS